MHPMGGGGGGCGVAANEYSARIYRPAFSWKQAQDARIQS
jgi:hypothetical protein